MASSRAQTHQADRHVGMYVLLDKLVSRRSGGELWSERRGRQMLESSLPVRPREIAGNGGSSLDDGANGIWSTSRPVLVCVFSRELVMRSGGEPRAGQPVCLGQFASEEVD